MTVPVRLGSAIAVTAAAAALSFAAAGPALASPAVPASPGSGSGAGGILAGSVVDHLASQGSLSYDPGHALLYAVNAGSDTISVFAVGGDHLALRQVLSSGGSFPVSVAVHGDRVRAQRTGRWPAAGLQGAAEPYPGPASRLGPRTGPESHRQPAVHQHPRAGCVHPDGRQVVVTTKANGNDIDVFGVRPGGWLSARPVVNPEPGTVPFAITFDAGHLVIAEAGTNALATFTLSASGTVNLIGQVGTGAAATCWVAPAGSFLFASNAGSASESGFTSSAGGQLSLLGAASTDPGTVDASAAAGGQFLYVQTGGNGIVDEFGVGASGSLTKLGSVSVPGAVGGEGIVAF